MIDTKEMRQLASQYVGLTAWTPVPPQELIEFLDRLDAAENDAAHQKALADSALRVAEGWERKCGELRAKIEAMEKQEPVAEIGQQYTLLFAGSGPITGVVKRHGLKIGDKLYALPGAQTQGEGK